jgi:hypothetical protein
MNFVNQCLVFVQWRIVVEETVLKINRVKKQSQYYLKTAVLNIFSHIKARVENSYSENWYEVFGKRDILDLKNTVKKLVKISNNG